MEPENEPALDGTPSRSCSARAASAPRASDAVTPSDLLSSASASDSPQSSPALDATTPLPDFVWGLPGREPLWASLPAPVKAYVAELRDALAGALRESERGGEATLADLETIEAQRWAIERKCDELEAQQREAEALRATIEAQAAELEGAGDRVAALRKALFEKSEAAEALAGEVAALRRRADGGDEERALAEAAWAARFQPALTFKVKMLQHAHHCALTRLRAKWDERRFSHGGAAGAAPASIHVLPSDVVERVIQLVPGKDVTWESKRRAWSTPLRQLKGDLPWQARRTCTQVNRLFEALTYAHLDTTHHHIDSPVRTLSSRAPPGFAVRELERCALSACLTRVEIFLPAPGSGLVSDSLDVAAAAAVLPACLTLDDLRLYVTSAHPDAAAIPEELTAALPRCRRLHTLQVAAYDRVDGDRVKLEVDSVDRLAGAVSAASTLACLELKGLDVDGTDVLYHAVAAHPALHTLRLLNTKASPGWLRFVVLPRLTWVDVQWCWEWKGLTAFSGDVPPAIQLRELVLLQTDMTEQEHLRLGELLPKLYNLTRLYFSSPTASAAAVAAIKAALTDLPNLRTLQLGPFAPDVGCRLLPALPRCARLRRLSLHRHVDVTKAWVAALAAALPACAELAELLLEHFEFNDGGANSSSYDSNVVALAGSGAIVLEPLFDALPRCPKLEELTVRRVALGLRGACALCADIPEYRALKTLTLDGVGLDELTAKVVVSLARLAPQVRLQVK